MTGATSAPDRGVTAALRLWLLAAVLALPALGARAADAPEVAADPALEARMHAIAAELRCLVCQNQTIADSNAPLALDLRQQVREQLLNGRSREQIVDYMTARYGDFVLYRPPVRPTTVLLWYGPALLLLLGVSVLLLTLRRRARMAADRFEPDPEELV